jgi:hypothetical protein
MHDCPTGSQQQEADVNVHSLPFGRFWGELPSRPAVGEPPQPGEHREPLLWHVPGAALSVKRCRNQTACLSDQRREQSLHAFGGVTSPSPTAAGAERQSTGYKQWSRPDAISETKAWSDMARTGLQMRVPLRDGSVIYWRCPESAARSSTAITRLRPPGDTTGVVWWTFVSLRGGGSEAIVRALRCAFATVWVYRSTCMRARAI